MKGPQAVVVFGKVGREGLRGPGNTATVLKTVEGWTIERRTLDDIKYRLESAYSPCVVTDNYCTLPSKWYLPPILKGRACVPSACSHKVCIYIDYHSVCPLVGIVTLPTPLSPASVPLPPEWGGGHTRQRVRGWGSPNSDDWRKSLALCLLSGLSVSEGKVSQKIPYDRNTRGVLYCSDFVGKCENVFLSGIHPGFIRSRTVMPSLVRWGQSIFMLLPLAMMQWVSPYHSCPVRLVHMTRFRQSWRQKAKAFCRRSRKVRSSSSDDTLSTPLTIAAH